MTEALRILLVGDYGTDPRLGSSKVYHKLHEEFTQLGHRCDLILGAELGTWPRQPKIRWAVAPLLAARAVARFGAAYDVIDVASAEGSVLGLRRALTPGSRVALVSRSHGLEHRNYQRLLDDHTAGLTRKRWYRRWWYPTARLSQVALAARLADRMIVLNPGDAEFVVARRWKTRAAIDVIPHGVSARFLDDAPPPGAPRGRGILFCGTWDDMKGVRYLAAAFAQLLDILPDVRLTVLGPGLPEAAVLSDFMPGVRHAVTVIPRLDEPEVMAQYRTHDLLVLPSSYEGFGMVVVEAMSQRLPVVATPMGAAMELVRDGETGILVPLRSAGRLAAAMRRLLTDHDLASRLAEAAYAQASTHTWTRTAQRTIASYRAAIASRVEGR